MSTTIYQQQSRSPSNHTLTDSTSLLRLRHQPPDTSLPASIDILDLACASLERISRPTPVVQSIIIAFIVENDFPTFLTSVCQTAQHHIQIRGLSAKFLMDLMAQGYKDQVQGI